MSGDSQSGETIASRYNGIGRFSVEGVIKIAQVEILYTKEVDFSKERSIFFEKKQQKTFIRMGWCVVGREPRCIWWIKSNTWYLGRTLAESGVGAAT